VPGSFSTNLIIYYRASAAKFTLIIISIPPMLIQLFFYFFAASSRRARDEAGELNPREIRINWQPNLKDRRCYSWCKTLLL
jgi:hypothetical protein